MHESPTTPSSLARWLRGACIYIQISPSMITVHNCTTHEIISAPPDIALRHSAKVTMQGFGIAAHDAMTQAQVEGLPPGVTMELVNPFLHPRTLIADASLAKHLVSHYLQSVHRKKWMQPSPWLVIHPQGIPEGGYTAVEIQTLLNLGNACGAISTVIWQGTELTSDHIRSRIFPETGKILG